MTCAFSWQNFISLCPASFCTPRPNFPVTPGISRLPTFAFQSPIMKRAYYKVTAPFLLGPGFCLCPPKSVSQPCVSSSGSVVQLLESSSKRAYAIPSSAAPRAPASAAGLCWLSVPLQEALKHSKASLIQSLWGLLVCTRFCLSPLSILAGMEFDSKCDFVPPTILLGLLLFPWTWGIFFFLMGANILLSGCPAASCNFGVLTGDESTIFYSANTQAR